MFETETASNINQGGTYLPGQDRQAIAVGDLFPTDHNSLNNQHSLVADLATDLFQTPDQHALVNSIDCLIESNSSTTLPVATIAESGQLIRNDNSYDEITGETTDTGLRATTEGKKADPLNQGGDTPITDEEEANIAISEGRFNRDMQPIAHHKSDEEAGNTPKQSMTIGSLGYRDKTVITGRLDAEKSESQKDYFNFEASKDGAYEIKLEELSSNSDFTIYDESGRALKSSNNQGTENELITIQLDKGSYHIKVYTDESIDSNYKLSIEGLGNKREQEISSSTKDASIKNAALNSIKHDSKFSREDLIGILKSAGDNGEVSQAELTDLKNLWNQQLGQDASLRDDCKRLAQKVIFGDESNKWYTGKDNTKTSLGNLKSGSSTQHLNLLIGKHFLGTDRPAIRSKHISRASYSKAGGELFQDGISIEDIKQGKLGTCYLLGALGGYAQKQPEVIKDSFHDNGDGTWTVRIYQNGKADYVTVDRELPTDNQTGRFIYASSPNNSKISSDKNELWVALYEKAYAQMNESGQLNQDGINHYDGIDSGHSKYAIKHISNEDVRRVKTKYISKQELIYLANSDQIITTGSFNKSIATGKNHGENAPTSALSKHVYVISQYDQTSKRFHLFNTWGKKHLKLTFEELQVLKGKASITPPHKAA